MVETRYDNCGILTKMGDNSTHDGTRKPPVDGVDFPHTGLIKLFDAQRYGYVILSKDVTTGSSSSTAGSVFDCNFNIGMDDTTSSGNTTISVMSGAVIRDGILVNVSTGASVGVGVKITEITSGTPAGNATDGFTEFIEQGTSGQNFYHVIVVNHANNIRIRNPSAQDTVAELGAGDIPIAILRVQNGETPTTRHIQYLGTDRRSGGLSVYYKDGTSPTEALQISASAGDTTIENKVQDKDIIFKANDGGVSTEIMRIDGSTSRIGIGTNSPETTLHLKSSASQQPRLLIENTNTDVEEPMLIMRKNSATPNNDGSGGAEVDDLGIIRFEGEDSTGANTLYAHILAESRGVTNTQEAGKMNFNVMHQGTSRRLLLVQGNTTAGGSVMINDGQQDVDFIVEGVGNSNLIRTDAANDRVAIGHNSPTATLDMLTGGTFRNTRLLTVSVSAGTTLTEAAHAGRYNICAGNVTLPSTSTAGEHYAILNTTGGAITIGRNSRNINGAAQDFSVQSFQAATCIAIGSNNWMVIG